MQRTLVALIASFVLVALAAPAHAGDYARALPMQFELRYGPIENCNVNCRPWVSATGMIKPETARDFDLFAQSHNLRGATIAFDSEGGSVLGAVALGRAIRRLEMTTTVGRTMVPSSGDPRTAALSPRGDCDSMCAFVLMAGKNRFVPQFARVRVHQIWLGDRREDAMAASYSAEDLVLVQRDIGRIARYLVEMGGSIELLEIALRIPPWEPMRALTREELARLHLDGRPDPVETKPVAAVAMAGAASSTSAGRSTGINERGWGLIEASGRPALARRHPLTVEGEDIGSFDLMFACGDSPDQLVVTYAETRRTRDVQRAPAVLSNVEIMLGGRSTSLAIKSSSPGRPLELDTFASGMLTMASIKAFGEAANRSLTVTTSSRDKAATSIRVGNFGVVQNFSRLASACAKISQQRSANLNEKN
ncbi:MAG: hypothetical protein HY659_13580 [Rhizobiales bacterium]|nr:hypothetical protein [Hyphomicrobiales bacterium]